MRCIRPYWFVWTALGLLAILVGANHLGLISMWPAWGWGMDRGFGHGGWFMGGFMGLPMILFWLLVAILAWSLISGSGTGERQAPPAQAPDSARSILDQRYARGELNRDEYLAMRKDLEGN